MDATPLHAGRLSSIWCRVVCRGCGLHPYRFAWQLCAGPRLRSGSFRLLVRILVGSSTSGGGVRLSVDLRLAFEVSASPMHVDSPFQGARHPAIRLCRRMHACPHPRHPHAVAF